MGKILPLFFILLLFFNSSSEARPLLAITSDNGDDIIALQIGRSSPKKIFFLTSPDRLVIDLPYNDVPDIDLPTNYRGRLVDKVRAGRFNTDTLRIVFDLKKSAGIERQSHNDGILTLHLKAGSHEIASPPPPKPMIVIDAGHGGKDVGAIGPKGSYEKDIVLAYAITLQDALINTGRYRVYLTRESDKFIPLRERVKLARDAGGSVFLSIHADSAPKKHSARGLSIYTLSEKASDEETAALAANENNVDILAGMDLSNEREDVADILISLAQRETRNQSAMLADLLTLSLAEQVTLLTKPHRFAGFAVLKAPDIPSVLIETGFISHPEEERLLKTKAYRDKIIKGIIDAIDTYFEKQKELAP